MHRSSSAGTPAWNYLVVHAHGRITVRDHGALRMSQTSRSSHVCAAGQWKMGDAPKDSSKL
ncbi:MULTISPECIES: FMN-binding negative transcriptional regulator [unclassified Mesorhizobium]|uniref:FMN-binding negative transcriptional regulator n=1 Tax=unclassified Mesorhizobium TaxID=325217 RepID=UPI003336967A